MKKMIASALIAFSLCFAASCKPVWQQDPGNAAYERGQEAHDRGDLAEALEEWQLAANQGNAKAQYRLGAAYYAGEGVTLSYEEAAALFLLSSKQGNADAQHNLGVMYSDGRGVPQSYDEARHWYTLAADQGHAGAQRSVGFHHELGFGGVPASKVEAAKWYLLAAEQGDPFAQFALGSMYAKGEGVPRNDLLAYKWWNLAAAHGLGNPANITTLEGRMTPDQIAEAQKLSAEWKPLSER